jgi:hypothetical protein
MLANCPVDGVQLSVGRSESTRAPPMGATGVGAVAFRVEPSGAAVVVPPSPADGEVGVCGVPLHAAIVTAAARAALVVQSVVFIRQKLLGETE